jgi:hypothetical protein
MIEVMLHDARMPMLGELQVRLIELHLLLISRRITRGYVVRQLELEEVRGLRDEAKVEGL